MRKMPMSLRSCLLIATLSACGGCASMHHPVTTPEASARISDPALAHPELIGALHDFGDVPGLTALMDDFMDILVADPRTHRQFVDADQPRIKRQLIEQFCAILGGGCTYSGRDMREAHAGLGIDHARFYALVEDLQLAMNRRKVPFRAQNKLLAILAPMHREVIER